MIILQRGNAVLLVFLAAHQNVKVAQFIDHQQIIVVGNLLPEDFLLPYHVAAFFFGVGVEVPVDCHNAVVIRRNAGNQVGVGGFQFAARYSRPNLGRRGNAHIGNEHIAVIQALLFHFHNDGIVAVAVFRKVFFQRRAAGSKKAGIQRIDIDGGQNIAQGSVGQHDAGLQDVPG